MSKISAFIQNPDKNGLVDVYADGELIITLTEDAVIEAGLFVGMDIDAEALSHIEYSNLLVKAKQKAYNYLSYGDMSAATLKRKLVMAGFDEFVADDCVMAMAQAGYVDDVRYAQLFANYLATVKNYGQRRIMQELLAKGVAKDIADEVIGALDVDYFESVKKHIPAQIDFSDKKQLSRLINSLLRRGFDYDTVRSVISQCTDEDF